MDVEDNLDWLAIQVELLKLHRAIAGDERLLKTRHISEGIQQIGGY